MRSALVLLALALVAAIPAQAHAACALPAGWTDLVRDDTRYVIFGELHGTAESPKMFGEAACALAERGERLLIALELTSTQNANLQRAWALPDAEFESALPKLMPEWSSRNDGVTSRAMLAMLVRLHAARAAGRVIDVVAFNGARDDAQSDRFRHLPGQGPHEAAQAENIRQAAEAKIYDRVLVLVGEAHAREAPVAPGKTSFEPMAMRLAPPRQIISLKMVYGKGSTWACPLVGKPTPGKPVTSDMLDCRVHELASSVDWTGPPRLGPAKGIDDPDDPAEAYDGAYFVGPATASLPVAGER